MGRKEGGSLFHQAISKPEVFALSDRTKSDGSPMPVSFCTRRNYCNWLHKAMEYFKEKGIRKLSDITAEQVQEYADHLAVEGKTASTIHSYIAPVCKAVGVSMTKIGHPRRKASEFTRSSGIGKKNGGIPAELNAALGIRKDELLHLRGNNLIEKHGVLYVVVENGKGGKYQEQKVLPQHEKLVKAFFNGSMERLFKKKDMVNGFDYHGQRRALAQEALRYYLTRLKTEPTYRKELYKEIARQWHANNKKHRDKLEPLSYFDLPYKLRGENRELAKKQGLPAELDRLALRAVSVLHLAHWRDKVTIQSYYFER